MTEKEIQEIMLCIQKLHTHGDFEKYGDKEEDEILCSLSKAADILAAVLEVLAMEPRSFSGADVGEGTQSNWIYQRNIGYNEALKEVKQTLMKG